MDEFDKMFNHTWKAGIAMVGCQVFVTAIVLGFLGWVIVQLLQYFGVI